MSQVRWVTQISYDDLLRVVELMRGFPRPWYVSGGWALDCFLDRVTREHQDLEIGIAREDQGLLHAHLDAWQLLKLQPREDEGEIVPWPAGEVLALPDFQIVVRNEGFRPAEFEFFLNEVWDGAWHFRRDHSIRRPIEESYLVTTSGIPVIAPEIQLLYKARIHRPKDEHDFHAVLPSLSPPQRDWLRKALKRFRPADPWLEQLGQ